jgi:hypothetical protein
MKLHGNLGWVIFFIIVLAAFGSQSDASETIYRTNSMGQTMWHEPVLTIPSKTGRYYNINKVPVQKFFNDPFRRETRKK